MYNSTIVTHFPIYLFTVIYIAHFPLFNAQMRCTGYEIARYKGTQASYLYEKSMHTLCVNICPYKY